MKIKGIKEQLKKLPKSENLPPEIEKIIDKKAELIETENKIKTKKEELEKAENFGEKGKADEILMELTKLRKRKEELQKEVKEYDKKFEQELKAAEKMVFKESSTKFHKKLSITKKPEEVLLEEIRMQKEKLMKSTNKKDMKILKRVLLTEKLLLKEKQQKIHNKYKKMLQLKESGIELTTAEFSKLKRLKSEQKITDLELAENQLNSFHLKVKRGKKISGDEIPAELKYIVQKKGFFEKIYKRGALLGEEEVSTTIQNLKESIKKVKELEKNKASLHKKIEEFSGTEKELTEIKNLISSIRQKKRALQQI